ncbi:uncharacterized protein LOC117176464 [Belonocnema kinseyi]|uniref:uncharacterized protein LOC117176464 n=1 Tax=Belonocnema kinseyi TaxID=2817044 RepID=UPI00143DD365|nr:uncharacterized protein LOC117176464 [Belonocnema kinseyi]XP_033222601.1 uncharacterized protein LOC117176464 [Belonocnema kinseyi]XP_033222602.1 uncharacterized protein LOC117176464 [Belonocnema kinseyi]XP_033222604.1 uncharacterized protein LOC117176464 [Belonocnema kinseyi]XP_033222605.1 uncharacterized protein LOC117176464 [Belonocnema kinseyi]
MATKTNKIVGCIGKCTSGLTLEELDQITDHINQTLLHAKGREVFRKYLTLARRKDDLACLEFYENCSEYIEKEENYVRRVKEPTLDFLKNDFANALAIAEDIDVPEIDLAILERFVEALDSESREAMLSVLNDTKLRLMDHLRNAHRGFRIYVLQPCPKTK